LFSFSHCSIWDVVISALVFRNSSISFLGPAVFSLNVVSSFSTSIRCDSLASAKRLSASSNRF
uniref:Secreted protein n=1 Tax=Haemonchus placei TaxID=6290 RepID=A0A158QMN7_HAEPC